MSIAVANATTTQEAREFCAAHDLSSALDNAVGCLSRAFPEAARITVELEQDPNSHSRWLLIDVLVAGDLADIHGRHRDCARDVARTLKLPNATLIRTNYAKA